MSRPRVLHSYVQTPLRRATTLYFVSQTSLLATLHCLAVVRADSKERHLVAYIQRLLDRKELLMREIQALPCTLYFVLVRHYFVLT